MVFSKILNLGRHKSSNPVISVVGIIGLTTCLIITGCNKTEETLPEDGLSQSQSIEQEEDVTGQSVITNEGSNSNPVSEGTKNNTPVTYDVQNWQAHKGKNLTSADLTDLQSIFGEVKLTDKHSLDYASNMAVKYRFMEGADPYLDIIDSNQYLEFGWYYANPNDSETEKKISIDHAKKAFIAATALMGEEGGKLVSSMLSGQNIKNKEVTGVQVELAKCEFYSCVLTIKK